MLICLNIDLFFLVKETFYFSILNKALISLYSLFKEISLPEPHQKLNITY